MDNLARATPGAIENLLFQIKKKVENNFDPKLSESSVEDAGDGNINHFYRTKIMIIHLFIN